ncbi:tigger transposable element-derived protein 1-like [Phymastichus coffea]|uniref:tigger transposable element-derived protein 1-like n=1 Tax=Phymastichus coffea TaxID=108790 RepID=UPI00273C75E7|nr:tigger transposable element-derived protein 1-like [Phymastichus coffea]
MEKMEDMLYIWIEDKTRQRVPLSSAVIREQALYYFDYLNKEISKTNEKFTASKGWFEGFKKRYSLHNVKFSGESASADYKAATEFPKVFKELIAEKGYHASQVFNCDETGLFWKKMPNRTFLTKDENKAAGFKISKDRYTLMLCSNASGTYKCKPLLVYKSELWPEIVQDKQPELNAQQIAQQVVEVAKGIEADGFKDMEAAEVVNLINENIDLTPSVLVEILDPGHVPDDEDDLGSQEEPPHLSYKTVANAMSLIQEAFELLILNDPIMSRSIKFRHDCEEAMRPYTELQSDEQNKVV